MKTVYETAELFNVTKTTVYNWLKAGLPSKKEKVIGIKTRILIDPKDVMNFLGIKSENVDLNEKVLDEWIARFEEAVKNYHIHKNKDWLEQIQISRSKIKELFAKQQAEMLKNRR